MVYLAQECFGAQPSLPRPAQVVIIEVDPALLRISDEAQKLYASLLPCEADTNHYTVQHFKPDRGFL